MNDANNNIVQVTAASDSIEYNAIINQSVEDINMTNNYTNMKSKMKWTKFNSDFSNIKQIPKWNGEIT